MSREVVLPKLDGDGPGSESITAQVSHDTHREALQFNLECRIVSNVVIEGVFAAHGFLLFATVQRRGSEALRFAHQPFAELISQIATQRQRIRVKHVGHAHESEARQPLLRLRSDARNLSQPLRAHEPLFVTRGYYSHAGCATPRNWLGSTSGDLGDERAGAATDGDAASGFGDDCGSNPLRRFRHRLLVVHGFGAGQVEIELVHARRYDHRGEAHQHIADGLALFAARAARHRHRHRVWAESQRLRDGHP